MQLSSAESCSIRCCEYHYHPVGGGLPDVRHYDMDSLITIDIMLDQPNVHFQGGHFQTLEQNVNKSDNEKNDKNDKNDKNEKDDKGDKVDNGKIEDTSENIKQHIFEQGDALVFVSHKYHCVSPVLSGLRRVLVTELWGRSSRCCAHRCESLKTRCPQESPSTNTNEEDTTTNEKQTLYLPFRLASCGTWKNQNHGNGRMCQRLLWQSNEADGDDVENDPMQGIELLLPEAEAWNVFGSDSDSDDD